MTCGDTVFDKPKHTKYEKYCDYIGVAVVPVFRL
jgi:hypothetical protein